MFKLQSPSKYSPFDTVHLRHFPLLKTVFKFVDFNAFWWLCLFFLIVSPLPHQQNVSLWGLFSSGETKKKVAWGGIEWIERVGHGGRAVFGQKLLNTQHCVGRYAHKSPIVKWAKMLNESLKKFTTAEYSLLQQHQLVQWYRWVPRTLTGGSLYYKGLTLQKIIQFFVSPLIYWHKYYKNKL